MTHRDEGRPWQHEQGRSETRYGRGGRSAQEDQSDYSARVQRQNQGYERGYDRGREGYYGNRPIGERAQGHDWDEGRESTRANWEYEGGPERYGTSGYSESEERGSRHYGLQRGQPMGRSHEQGAYGSGSSDYHGYGSSDDYSRGQSERSSHMGTQSGRRTGYGGSFYGTRSGYGGESAGFGGRGSLHGGEYSERSGLSGSRHEEEWAGNRYSSEAGRHAYGGYGTGYGYRGMGPKNYRRSDERLTEEINERLTDADDLDAREITVRVADGKVTLEGSVDQRWMKHRAEDIADACIGVKEVDNRITVMPSSSALAGRDTMGPGTSRTSTTSGGTMTGEDRPGMGGATPH